MADNIILLEGVDIRNSGNLILSDIHLSIDKGEFVYIIGKVGSGKTSLIKALIGETYIDKGEARVAEFDLMKLKKRQIPYLRRRIGVVFQDFQLLMDRTIYENLLFVLKATGWKEKKLIDAKISKVLEDVGMSLKAHKMPHQLSGGEQQRIAIARALLNDPDIILADEPTGNLDNDTATGIMDLLMSIHNDRKPAIVMVTHNQSLFRRYQARTLICENMSLREVQESHDYGLNLSDIFSDNI